MRIEGEMFRSQDNSLSKAMCCGFRLSKARDLLFEGINGQFWSMRGTNETWCLSSIQLPSYEMVFRRKKHTRLKVGGIEAHEV